MPTSRRQQALRPVRTEARVPRQAGRTEAVHGWSARNPAHLWRPQHHRRGHSPASHDNALRCCVYAQTGGASQVRKPSNDADRREQHTYVTCLFYPSPRRTQSPPPLPNELLIVVVFECRHRGVIRAPHCANKSSASTNKRILLDRQNRLNAV